MTSAPPRSETTSESTVTTTPFCFLASSPSLLQLLRRLLSSLSSSFTAFEEEQERRSTSNEVVPSSLFVLAVAEEPPNRLSSGEEGEVKRSSSLISSVTTVECGAERRRGFGEGERERERGDERRLRHCCCGSCPARGETGWVSIAGGAAAAVAGVETDAAAVFLRREAMTSEPDSPLGCPATSGLPSCLRYTVGRAGKGLKRAQAWKYSGDPLTRKNL